MSLPSEPSEESAGESKGMARWRVDYIGKGGKHLGTVEAADESSAIAEAMQTFHITPARRYKIVVTKIDPARK